LRILEDFQSLDIYLPGVTIFDVPLPRRVPLHEHGAHLAAHPPLTASLAGPPSWFPFSLAPPYSFVFFVVTPPHLFFRVWSCVLSPGLAPLSQTIPGQVLFAPPFSSTPFVCLRSRFVSCALFPGPSPFPHLLPASRFSFATLFSQISLVQFPPPLSLFASALLVSHVFFN